MALPDHGQAIAGFALVGLLGQGASGKVYRARAAGGTQDVALKVLRAPPTSGRFARELATLRALNHPQIPSLVDHGELDDGRVYLVTELVEGTGLDRLLARRSLSRGQLIGVLADAADVVAYAHGADVLHRDLKPANLLVDDRGRAHVLDFGLASFADEVGMLTRSGAAIGTPMYIAPEVLEQGTSASAPPGDVYALGIMLYEGLTGRHPFAAASWDEIHDKVLAGVVPPLPGVPPWLRSLCLESLARYPDERVDAASMAARLRANPAPVDSTLIEQPAGRSSSSEELPSVDGPITPRGVGARVGPYVIERRLGEGAMGAVYVGRHSESDLRHAVKVVRSRKASHRERLEREARALAKVDDHPGVVGVHRFGTLEEGEAYFALDLIEGSDLEVQLAGGPLPVERAVRYAAGIAEALAHVHARGIVHRDVKPSNVLLRAEDDAPVLTDFGLALDPDELRMTAANALIGTPSYMAPEQAEGRREDVGPHTDVFALGSVLYELLTGEPPFNGLHFVSVMRAILLRDPEPPSVLRGEVPRELDRVVLAALTKEHELRPTAAELAEALRQLSRGERVELASRSGAALFFSRRTRRVLRLVVPAVLLLGLGIGLAAVVLPGRVAQQTEVLKQAEAAAEQVQAFRRDVARWHIRPKTFDPEDLARAREELAATSDRLTALGRFEPELTAAQAELTRALACVPFEEALGRGDLQAASAALHLVDATDRPLRELVLHARQEGSSASRFVGRSAPKLGARDQDEAWLLAASVALDWDDLVYARRALEAVPSRGRLDPLREHLRARVLATEGLRAVAQGDVAATVRALTAARAIDAEVGEQAFAASIPTLREAHRGPLRELVPIVDGLVAAGGSLPGAVELYEDVASGLASGQSVQAGLEVAKLFERALRLEPLHRIEPGLISWLGLQGREAYGRGRLRDGLAIYVAITRAGRVVGHEVPARLMLKLHAAGVIPEALQVAPNDWALRYWQGRALYCEATINLSGALRAEVARRAEEIFESCLDAELPPRVRAELHVRRFTAQGLHRPEGLPDRLEAFLAAHPEFPEAWRLLLLAVHRSQGVLPVERRLRLARRAIDLCEERVAATREDRLAPDERAELPARLDGPYSAWLNARIDAGDYDGVLEFMESRKAKSVYLPKLREQWRERVARARGR